MDLKKHIINYLNQVRTMQLATAVSGRPWACTVHFFSDENLNFYWLSTPDRRHSQDIEQNQNVAIAVQVHEDTPKEDYVVGVSAEGKAQLINRQEENEIAHHYIAKLKSDPQLLADIQSGKNPHKFYRLTPAKVVLFDNKYFPDDPRKELELGQ